MKTKLVEGLLVVMGWIGFAELIRGGFSYNPSGEIVSAIGALIIATVCGLWLIYSKLNAQFPKQE